MVSHRQHRREEHAPHEEQGMVFTKADDHQGEDHHEACAVGGFHQENKETDTKKPPEEGFEVVDRGEAKLGHRRLDAFFEAAEADVEFVEGCKELAKGKRFRELGKGVDVFGEAFAAVAEFAIGSGDVGVGVVNVPGEENAGVHALVVCPKAAAVVGNGVEVGHLNRPKDVVGVFGNLCLEGGHVAELLTNENLGEEIEFAGEDHGLALEVFDVGALGEEFGHEVNLVPGLLGEALGGAWKNSRANEDGNVREAFDNLRGEGEVLRAVVFGGNMEGDEDNVGLGEVVIHPFGRVADENVDVGVVFFKPYFEGATDVTATNNTDIYHDLLLLRESQCIIARNYTILNRQPQGNF